MAKAGEAGKNPGRTYANPKRDRFPAYGDSSVKQERRRKRCKRRHRNNNGKSAKLLREQRKLWDEVDDEPPDGI